MNILNEIKVQEIPGKECGLVYITPEQAKQIFEQNANPNNRRMDNFAARKYAGDMDNGDFAETTLLTFDANGMMLDGHTRMKALSESKCSGQWFVMLHGAKNDRFIFDRGRGRTITQNINMNGNVKRTSYDIAVANMAIDVENAYACGSIAKSNFRRASDAEVMDFLDANQATFDMLHSYGKGNGIMTRKAPVATAIFQALRCGVDESILNKFSDVINNGYMSDKSESAAITLRKQLEKYNPSGSKRIMYEHAAEESIAAFITGTSRKQSFKGETCPYTMILANRSKKEG